jgi:dipeptidyl aminopeptidase/acylaminoacyl peptidase
MNRRNYNLLLLIAFIATALTVVGGGVFVFRARDARRDLALVADRLATEVAARMTAEAVAATHQAEVQVATTRVATGASARATEAAARDTAVAISATRQAEAQATATAEVGRRQAAEAERAEAEYQARRDRARALAAAVQLELSRPDYDPSLALLLSIEAVNTTWTTDGYVVLAADTALHDAVGQVEALGWRMSLPRHWHDGAVNSAAFSPNGKLIVTAGDDRTVRLLDATTMTQVRLLVTHAEAVTLAAFSPDGKTIVTAGCDRFEGYQCTLGSARLWDVATGAELLRLEGHTGWVNSAAFSPDGAMVVTAGCDEYDDGWPCARGTSRLWDAATGAELRQLESHKGGVNAAAFSPDGTMIATAGEAWPVSGIRRQGPGSTASSSTATG